MDHKIIYLCILVIYTLELVFLLISVLRSEMLMDQCQCSLQFLLIVYLWDFMNYEVLFNCQTYFLLMFNHYVISIKDEKQVFVKVSIHDKPLCLEYFWS
jgi:fumarate reductase subunit C